MHFLGKRNNRGGEMLLTHLRLFRGFLLLLIFFEMLIGNSVNEAMFNVSFDESMQFHNGDPFNKKNNEIVKVCKELYERNWLPKLEPKDQPLIPKKLHLIWLGPKNPPAIFAQCLGSIEKHLPGWEVRIWKDRDMAGLNLYNQKYFDEEVNYAAKADILRYEILYRFGGVYIDVDIILLKDLDILIHTYEFFAGLEACENEAILGNAIIASAPGHPILKNCIDMIQHHRTGDLLDWKVVQRTGPVHFQKSFYDIAKQFTDIARVIVLPSSFFFPVSYKDRNTDNIKKNSCVKNETFCVHHWTNSWVEPIKPGPQPVPQLDNPKYVSTKKKYKKQNKRFKKK